MCCSSTVEVWTFLAQMCVKHEELMAIGITMTDKDYQSAILKSVPEEMSKFALNLLTMSCIFQPTSSLDPNLLIGHISEKADCLTAQHKCDGTSKVKGRQAGPQDKVLAATQNDWGGHCHCKGKCCNCSKEGHWVQECQSPKKKGLDQEGNPQDSQQST